MSLTTQQLEMLCEMYCQAADTANVLEMLQRELPKLISELCKPDTKNLRVLQTFLIILLSQKWARPDDLQSRPADVRGISKLQGISERTVQRDLERLEELQMVEPMQTKGRWALPHSRKTKGAGCPPAIRVINPLLARASDWITSDGLDPDHRRFLSTAERFLLTTVRFKSTCERLMNSFLQMVPYLPTFAEAMMKIPEFHELAARYGLESPPHELQRVGYAIPGEVARDTMLAMRIPIDGERLPREEERRLGTLLGF